MSKLHIGFIGLGNMGAPMARNLIKAGHKVTAYDLNATVLNNLAKDGAIAAADATQCATEVDVLISMLPAGKHVRALYLGDEHSNGLINTVTAKTLVIDCSTIDAESARAVGHALAAKGIHFVDAPVSGGVAGATAGTLTFIVGGDTIAFEQAQVVLGDMGKNIFHAGAIGAGQIAKICNNMLLSILMAGTSEALQLGINNGLDAKVLSEIMYASSGRNWTLELYNPCPGVMANAPASNNYQPGFMVDLMAKDLALAMSVAQHSNCPTPMGSMAQNLYTLLQHQGVGTEDFSAIFKLFSH